MMGKWYGRLEMELRSVHKELWGPPFPSLCKLQSSAIRPGERAWGHDYDADKSNGAKSDPALVDIYRVIKTRNRFISLSLRVIPSTP